VQVKTSDERLTMFGDMKQGGPMYYSERCGTRSLTVETCKKVAVVTKCFAVETNVYGGKRLTQNTTRRMTSCSFKKDVMIASKTTKTGVTGIDITQCTHDRMG